MQFLTNICSDEFWPIWRKNKRMLSNASGYSDATNTRVHTAVFRSSWALKQVWFFSCEKYLFSVLLCVEFWLMLLFHHRCDKLIIFSSIPFSMYSNVAGVILKYSKNFSCSMLLVSSWNIRNTFPVGPTVLEITFETFLCHLC